MVFSFLIGTFFFFQTNINLFGKTYKKTYSCRAGGRNKQVWENKATFPVQNKRRKKLQKLNTG